MTQHPSGNRRGAVAVVLLALLPLTVVVVSFGPMAVAVGSAGVHQFVYPESHLTYEDARGEPVTFERRDLLSPQPSVITHERNVARLRRSALTRMMPLLFWSLGVFGLIALLSAVVPVAVGRRNGVPLGPWRGVALVGGVAAALWLLVELVQVRGPQDKAGFVWLLGLGYCALAGLAAASWVTVHRSRLERPR